jgi:hypothetical protein
MLVVSIVCLVMAATTFGSIKINSEVTVVTGSATDYYKIGETAPGHLTVTGVWTAPGSIVGFESEGTLTVATTGNLTMTTGAETFIAASSGNFNKGTVNVFGTAAFNEVKMGQYFNTSQEGFLNIGNGTYAASATLSRLSASTSNGQSTIIIKNGSTMTVTNTLDLHTGASLDLDGGTLKVATAIDTAGYASKIIAYGGAGTVFSEVIDANNVYTAEHGTITAVSENLWLTEGTVPITAEVRDFDDLDGCTYAYRVATTSPIKTGTLSTTVDQSNPTSTGVDLSAAFTFTEVGDYILEVEVTDTVTDTVTDLVYVDIIEFTVYADADAACDAAKADLPYGKSDALIIGDTNYDCKANLADFAVIASNWMVDALAI